MTKNLNDLLNKAFGSSNGKQSTTTEKKEKTKREYRTQRGVYLTKKECGELVYALISAINSIKNKPDVKEKKEFSARYEHFKRWNKILDKIQEKIDK